MQQSILPKHAYLPTKLNGVTSDDTGILMYLSTPNAGGRTSCIDIYKFTRVIGRQ